MKTTTKSQVIKYIKDHGTEGAFEWRATINGVNVGLCKTTIILYDEYTKFPPFAKVTLSGDGELEFETAKGKVQWFTPELRENGIVDKYFKVMEGILQNV